MRDVIRIANSKVDDKKIDYTMHNVEGKEYLQYEWLDLDKIEEYKFRKLIIKNHIAFYRINEDKKIVNVERILYGGIDLRNKL